jgi:hypothetical protein
MGNLRLIHSQKGIFGRSYGHFAANSFTEGHFRKEFWAICGKLFCERGVDGRVAGKLRLMRSQQGVFGRSYGPFAVNARMNGRFHMRRCSTFSSNSCVERRFWGEFIDILEQFVRGGGFPRRVNRLSRATRAWRGVSGASSSTFSSNSCVERRFWGEFIDILEQFVRGEAFLGRVHRHSRATCAWRGVSGASSSTFSSNSYVEGDFQGELIDFLEQLVRGEAFLGRVHRYFRATRAWRGVSGASSSTFSSNSCVKGDFQGEFIDILEQFVRGEAFLGRVHRHSRATRARKGVSMANSIDFLEQFAREGGFPGRVSPRGWCDEPGAIFGKKPGATKRGHPAAIRSARPATLPPKKERLREPGCSSIMQTVGMKYSK